MLLRPILAVAAIAACAYAADPAISPEAKSALDRISANALRGRVSFLASDLLEGRGTPSRGLELAAEYIAAEMRRIGLRPAGDQDYFQNARFLTVTPNREGLRLDVTNIPPIDLSKVTIMTPVATEIATAETVKFGADINIEDKVVFLYARDARQYVESRRRLAAGKPKLAIVVGLTGRALRRRESLIQADRRSREFPVLVVDNEELAAAIEKSPPGPLSYKVSVTIPAPNEKEVLLRNVVGVLPGSDPVLKDTYVLVTAHYDHIGLAASGDDRINNGANDNASGTASILEIANAIAGLPSRPKRTLVFIALFGEEVGLLGSRYYGEHPIFPLAKTVADINLEHMGRTDTDLGPHVALVNFTGFDFSDLPATFKRAGDATGIQVVKDEQNSDAYFSRSDNQALADVGIPAHTVSVGYEFSDYHRPGDHWDKIDYDNMARVARMLTLGLLSIADNPEPPKWNETVPAAAKYVEAHRKLMGAPAPQ